MKEFSCVMRSFVRLVAGVFLTLSGAIAYAQNAPPNFVIIVADDMSWDDAGVYGHPNIQTPNIDRLAEEGLRFEFAFLTTSSCSPSRSSVLTGRYPHATHAGELHLPLPADQLVLTELLRDRGYYTASAGKWHLGDPTRAKFDSILGGSPSGCEQWVQALEDRPKDAPFCLWLAALDPHRPYKEGVIPQPHTRDDAVVPPFLPDNAETRTDLALYYDEISRMDRYIGEVLDELERQEIADNTCVIFMSDNGRPFPRCKTTLYDSGIRTPFIVRFPGVTQPGTVCTSLISAVDLAPTIVELADASPSELHQGRSFAALLGDPKRETRKHAFAEHNWHDFAARERAVRSKTHLYIRNEYPDLPGTPPADAVRSITYQAMVSEYAKGRLPADQSTTFVAPRPGEELYDTEKDPHSLHNLANDEDHAEVLRELRDALDAWKVETEDTPREVRRPDEFDRTTGDRLEATAQH